MLLLIEAAIVFCYLAFLTAMSWSASPWFALFAWLCIGAAAWYQFTHPAAGPPRH